MYLDGPIKAHMKQTLLNALEADKKGDWDTAHKIVQEMEHRFAYWIHAYLHRKEPDLSNASYWYSRAQRKMPTYSTEEEWQEIYRFIRSTEIY